MKCKIWLLSRYRVTRPQRPPDLMVNNYDVATKLVQGLRMAGYLVFFDYEYV